MRTVQTDSRWIHLLEKFNENSSNVSHLKPCPDAHWHGTFGWHFFERCLWAIRRGGGYSNAHSHCPAQSPGQPLRMDSADDIFSRCPSAGGSTGERRCS